jgi:electron transfer flavoprotein alpha subunit
MDDAVWVFAECLGGDVVESSLEVICEGRRLAEILEDQLCVVLFGHQVTTPIHGLSRYGVETVYAIDDPLFEAYHPDFFTDALAGLVKAHGPGILLVSATMVGQDLSTRVAAKLRTALAPNCDKLGISDEGLLLQTRLIYQDKVHSTIVCPGARPQMATFKPGIGKAKAADKSKQVEMKIISVDHTDYMKPGGPSIEITGFIKADSRTIGISEAELIVSGGKGVKDEAHFQLIRDLADAIGAAVAGSRIAVDNQWIGRERQIGQSGEMVSPSLMISCGISGANAHVFGMRDTQTVIAINTDKAAPIMKLADLGVVGDLHEIIPEIIKQLKELESEAGTEGNSP